MKIIEARALLTAKDEASQTILAMAKKIEGVTKAQQAYAKAGGAQFAALAKQIETTNQKIAQARAYRDQTQKLADMTAAHQRARESVRGLAAQLMAADVPSRKLQQSYQRATDAADRMGRALDTQKARVRGVATDLDRMGISVKNLAVAERDLARQAAASHQAMARRMAVSQQWARRREAFGNAAALAGGMAAYRGKEIGRKSIVTAAEFDIGTRKQREFTDLTKDDQAGLLKQATKIGQDTQFSNLDVVKAQTKAMQGLPTSITGRLKAEVAEGILENVKNYALVMEADLETSAEALRSYLQATGKDISTKEKALAEANKATNQLVKMAKLGGMSDEDVQQYIKYAVPTGSAAGLTPESMMAIAALARRGGLRGDEAGVFMRATASKLAAPTKDGLAALNAAGIRYSEYVRMPSRLSVSGLQGQFRNDMGLNFTDATRKNLEGVLGNKDILGDRGKFIASVTEAISGQMDKTKKGTMKPADRVKVAKSAGKFHQMSAESVDAEALLDAVMSSNMTLAQLNAFLTNKHGGKGAITQRQREEYVAGRNELKKTGDDPDFAKRKADEIMAGLGGSLERLKGSVENFYLAIGQANEKILTFSFDKIGNAIDAVSNMSEPARQAVTALGSLAAVAAGAAGAWSIGKLLLTGGGLPASAIALNEAAAALNVAAVRLGASGAVGAAGPAAASAAGATAAGSTAGGAAAAATTGGKVASLARLGLYGVGAYLTYEAVKAIGEGNAKLYENVAPGEVHNESRKRRKSFNQALHDETNAVREKNFPTFAGGGFDLSNLSALQNLKAVVSDPIDVTGKLDPVELKGQAMVNITVKAAEGAQVAGMSVTSSGNIKAEGTALMGRFGRN